VASISKRVKKSGWTYELRWRENGKGHRLALQTQNLRTANSALRQLHNNLLEKKLGIIESNDLMLSEFRTKYLDHRKTRVAPTTVSADKYALNSLINCLGDIALKEISFSLLEDNFINVRLGQVKPGSVNVEIRHLKSAFTYAIGHEYIILNPFKKIKQLKVEKFGEKFFTIDDLKKIDTVINRQDDNQMMWFLILTGMRIGELLSLPWGEIHLNQGIIKVLGKGNKVRIIGISKDLKDLIENIHRDKNAILVFPGMRNSKGNTMEVFGKRSYSRIAKRFKVYFQEAGVEGTLHKFRHTFASQMLMKGVGERALQMLLGHESITTTEIYSHLSNDFLKDIMNKLRVEELLGDVG